ncbi:carboxyltransferase domain-containing protein [Brachybacterium sp. AOP25-B2-12]|uniref:carboxyltransferase domain-containing protein n=1 Tax=Brachybacterium sp. AOP25-B2-12 TaxID=3457710 RepID=UPI004034DF25
MASPQTPRRTFLAPPRAVHRTGELAVLADYPDTASVLAAAAALRALAPPGLVELVPAERTLLLAAATPVDLVRVRDALHVLAATAVGTAATREVEIPVSYDGEDLAEVAALLGRTPEALVAAHTQAPWTAAFVGFAPGFAYLVPTSGTAHRREDSRADAQGRPPWDVPRRTVPRTRVPSGSVALAAGYSAVYPGDSPGGWQLIGRTAVRTWDPAAQPPALLSPGTTVRFTAVRPHVELHGDRDGPATARPDAGAPAASGVAGPTASSDRWALTILDPGPLTLIQDAGRPGRADLGVTASGAADRTALALANAAVGNPIHAPALEMLIGPLTLRAERPTLLACAGAPAPLQVLAADGTDLGTVAGPGSPVRLALDAGDVVRIGPVTGGLRTVVAVRGALDAPTALGSASRDTLSGLGPAPLTRGARLRPAAAALLEAVPILDDAPPGDGTRQDSSGSPPQDPPGRSASPHPAPGAPRALGIVLGPRDDLLGPEAVTALLGTVWTVRPDSDRIGMRLDGPPLPVPSGASSLPSEPAVLGSIQVPPSGLPVVFGPDHPTTGGYPVIGVLTAAAMDLLAQCPPGTRVRLVRS